MIKVNKEARLTKATEFANSTYKHIQNLAEQGNDRIEVLFPQDVYRDSCTILEEMFKEENLNYKWLVVRRGSNPFTGRIDHFTSERVGDSVSRVIKIFS